MVLRESKRKRDAGRRRKGRKMTRFEGRSTRIGPGEVELARDALFNSSSQRSASLVHIIDVSMGSSSSKVAKTASRSFPKTPSASSAAGVTFPPPPISFPSPSSRPTPSPSSDPSSPSQPPPDNEPGSDPSSSQQGASGTKTDGELLKSRDEADRRPTRRS